ncbi:MAG: hypothetical protein EXR78_08260 [Deltaproteobacteria bacterium]|nr:hypothetical protein [Deltaproteobacteria bacterium]
MGYELAFQGNFYLVLRIHLVNSFSQPRFSLVTHRETKDPFLKLYLDSGTLWLWLFWLPSGRESTNSLAMSVSFIQMRLISTLSLRRMETPSLLLPPLPLGMMSRTNSFRGQCSPALPNPPDYPLTCRDRILLDLLLRQWSRRFVQGQKEWKTTALFRSLAVAFQAARIPSEISPSLYDLGTRIVLWVSAFEILAHPGGKGGRADLEKVLDLLSQASWIERRLKDRKFRIPFSNKKREATLGEKLYKQLYDARNNFAHGNPVNIHSIFPFKKKKLPQLNSIAPLLYRAALGAHLNLGSPTNDGNVPDPRESVKYCFSQNNYEKGLLSIMQLQH